MILLSVLFITVSAVHLKAPIPYDPVWLASVEQFSLANAPNDTRIFWPWVYETDVEFRLFTRRNPDEYQVLHVNDSESLRRSNFDIDNKVKVLTHGWLNHGFSPMPESIKEAYLNVSDLNIIVVDWGVAANVNYLVASYNVAQVGIHLTHFLNFLIDQGVSMDDVHLIGHSLGAHVVGIAGAYVQKGPIDTITGLDPALPLFTLGNPDARLDKHDARHVEVIHTCGGYLGFASPLGHVDFYPNGGSRQPGCGTDYRGFCAHNRAHMYFAESITSEVPFTAVRCIDYDELYYNGRCAGTGDTLPMGGFDIHYGTIPLCFKILSMRIRCGGKGESVHKVNDPYQGTRNTNQSSHNMKVNKLKAQRKEGIYYLSTGSEKPYALGADDAGPGSPAK